MNSSSRQMSNISDDKNSAGPLHRGLENSSATSSSKQKIPDRSFKMDSNRKSEKRDRDFPHAYERVQSNSDRKHVSDLSTPVSTSSSGDMEPHSSTGKASIREKPGDQTASGESQSVRFSNRRSKPADSGSDGPTGKNLAQSSDSRAMTVSQPPSSDPSLQATSFPSSVEVSSSFHDVGAPIQSTSSNLGPASASPYFPYLTV